MNAQFYQVCEQILSATANGVYQGILVTLLTGLALRWVIRTNAATRHAIWFGTLLLVAALIPSHLLLNAWRGPRSERAATPIAPPPPAIYDAGEDAGSPLPAPAATGAPVENVQPLDESGPPTVLVDEPLPQAPPTLPAAVPELQEPEAVAQPVPPSLPWWRGGFASVNSLLAKLPSSINLPHSVSLSLLGAWLLLAVFRAAKVLGRLVEIRRAKMVSTAPSNRLQELFDRLCAAANLSRPVRLRASDSHPTAMALGFLHPVVLLPVELDGEAADPEAEHILRHELAHIDRRDDWGNLIQQVIEAALFFDPAVWWISSRLSLEREIACDDHVLEASGQARGYALTLANAAFRLSHQRQLIAPGVFGNRSQLQQRITMILNTQRDRSSRLAKRWVGFFATTAAALTALAIVAGPRLVLAQSPDAPKDPPTQPGTADGTPVALPDNSAETGPRTKSGQDSDVVAPAAPAPEAPEVAEAPEPPEPPEAAEAPEAPEPPEAPEAPEAPAAIAVAPMPPMPAPTMTPMPPVAVFSRGGQMALVTSGPNMPPIALLSQDGADQPTPEALPDSDGPRHKDHGKDKDKDRKDMSIEERLDRIERTLDRLQARENRVFMRGPGAIKITPDASVQPDVQANVQPNLAFNFDMVTKEANRAAEQAKRAAEAGQRAAEAGQRAAEKAMRDMEKMQNQNMDKLHDEQARMGSMHELEALRDARNSLQSQVRDLEQQIHRLEADQNRHEGQKKQGWDGKTDGDQKPDRGDHSDNDAQKN